MNLNFTNAKRALNVILIIITLGFAYSTQAGAAYTPTYEWDRNTEYTNITNPGPDLEGNNVWSYEWFTGMDYLHTNPMTQITNWNIPQEKQRWEHGPLNISGWDQNTNYDSDWNTGFETTLIRWTNPVDNTATIDIDGSMTLYWGGDDNWSAPGNNASPVDVQFVLGYYDVSKSQATLLIDQFIDSSTDSSYGDSFDANEACNPFSTCPKYIMPLDYSVSMDQGDSIFWTAITLDQVTTNRWTTLNDNNMSITMVPEPISSALFLVGGVILGFRRFRK